MGKLEYHALRGIDLVDRAGELVAIVGPSGSGKTTILNLMTGIDRPSAGTVMVDGLRIDAMGEEALAVGAASTSASCSSSSSCYRRSRPSRTPFCRSTSLAAARSASASSVRGATSSSSASATRLDHLPAELSGGEQQRVAIARALAADPKLVVGDEPTGNLDSVTAREMFDLLGRLNDEGKTILYVTHDRELAARAPGSSRSATASSSREARTMMSALARKSITDLNRRRSRDDLRSRDAGAGGRQHRHLRAAGADGPRDAGAEVRAGKLADLTVFTSPLAARPGGARPARGAARTCGQSSRARPPACASSSARAARPPWSSASGTSPAQRVDVVRVASGSAPRARRGADRAAERQPGSRDVRPETRCG